MSEDVTGRMWVTFTIPATLALLAIAFASAFPPVLAAWRTDEYSHGIVIPILALLLGANLLAHAPPAIRPSWTGVPVLLIAGVLLLVGRLSVFPTASAYGFVLALFSVSLATLGRTATGRLLPAFAYLFFAIPLPNLVHATVSQDLQLFSSSLGVAVLDLTGVPVYQEGNVIDLGSIRLQVAEACNGLRYLFPLMSFGYLVAYLLRDSLWKRLLIFFSTLPIAILINALRITLIGFTVALWGNRMAEGIVHDFEGWVIFLICVALLLGEMRLLSRLKPRGHFRLEYLNFPRWPLIGGGLKSSAPGQAIFILCFILAATSLVDRRAEIKPGHLPLVDFPLTLSPWHGVSASLDAAILQSLQLSDYFLADYRQDNQKAPVDFYIAYYDRQRAGSTTHSPANCIPGGGWQIVSADVQTVGAGDGKTVTLSRLLIAKGGLRQLVYYWFDERGRDLTETTRAKWYLLVDAFVLNRSDGALIRLATPIAPEESENGAAERLQDFLRVAAPQIPRFVPGRKNQP